MKSSNNKILNESRICSVDRLVEMSIMAVRLVGVEILKHYKKKVVIIYKQDCSPLTLADQAARQVDVSHFVSSYLVVVSEEGENLHLDTQRYQVADPLDCTKNFWQATVDLSLI